MSNVIKVTDLKTDALAIYSQLSEGQLKHYYEPETGLFIAESPKVIGRALEAGYQAVSFLAEERILREMNDSQKINGAQRERRDQNGCAQWEEPGRLPGSSITEAMKAVPVYTAPLDVLRGITGYHLTSGLLCAMRRRVLPSAEEICRNARRIAVLERVVNPTNLGAIVRSAAALGMDAVLFSPDCCDPLYRRAIRVSMGTVFQIPWTTIGGNPDDWYEHGITMLRGMGFHTVAMALRDDTAVIDDPAFRSMERLAVVLGTEGEGLAERTICACDDTVMIPMSHGVDSLNVAAASAVAFWNLGKH